MEKGKGRSFPQASRKKRTNFHEWEVPFAAKCTFMPTPSLPAGQLRGICRFHQKGPRDETRCVRFARESVEQKKINIQLLRASNSGFVSPSQCGNHVWARWEARLLGVASSRSSMLRTAIRCRYEKVTRMCWSLSLSGVFLLYDIQLYCWVYYMYGTDVYP